MENYDDEQECDSGRIMRFGPKRSKQWDRNKTDSDLHNTEQWEDAGMFLTYVYTYAPVSWAPQGPLYT